MSDQQVEHAALRDEDLRARLEEAKHLDRDQLRSRGSFVERSDHGE